MKVAPSSFMQLLSADCIWVDTGTIVFGDSPSLVSVFRSAMLLMQPVLAMIRRVALCCGWALYVFSWCSLLPSFGCRAIASRCNVGCDWALSFFHALLMLL